jgi:hypothetical protein
MRLKRLPSSQEKTWWWVPGRPRSSPARDHQTDYEFMFASLKHASLTRPDGANGLVAGAINKSNVAKKSGGKNAPPKFAGNLTAPLPHTPNCFSRYPGPPGLPSGSSLCSLSKPWFLHVFTVHSGHMSGSGTYPFPLDATWCGCSLSCPVAVYMIYVQSLVYRLGSCRMNHKTFCLEAKKKGRKFQHVKTARLASTALWHLT